MNMDPHCYLVRCCPYAVAGTAWLRSQHSYPSVPNPLLPGALLPLCRRRHNVAPKPAQLPQCTESIAACCVVALMPSQVTTWLRSQHSYPSVPNPLLPAALLPFCRRSHNVAPKPAQLTHHFHQSCKVASKQFCNFATLMNKPASCTY